MFEATGFKFKSFCAAVPGQFYLTGLIFGLRTIVLYKKKMIVHHPTLRNDLAFLPGTAEQMQTHFQRLFLLLCERAEQGSLPHLAAWVLKGFTSLRCSGCHETDRCGGSRKRGRKPIERSPLLCQLFRSATQQPRKGQPLREAILV